MYLDLKELLTKDSMNIDEHVNFDQDYLKMSQIKGLEDIKVNGKIYYSINEELILDLKLHIR